MAGVLTLVDDPGAEAIDEEHLAGAIEVVKHYAAEAARLARAGMGSSDLQLVARLLDWLLTSWPEVFVSLPDIYQRSLNSIGDKATASRMVAILVDHGWLTKVEGGGEVAGLERHKAPGGIPVRMKMASSIDLGAQGLRGGAGWPWRGAGRSS